MSSVHAIALTGGPCGGKSTCLSVLEQELTNKGYKVFIIEEMATNVIKSGANPNTIGLMEFQKMLIQLQWERNHVYDEMAAKLAYEGNDVLLIYDRGIPDCKGFITDEQYIEILNELALNETHVMDYYDAVFHLVTAADGAPEAYTCENNSARTETPEQAIERDKMCMRAWTGHSHLRVVDNKDKTFKQKVDKLLEEVYSLLGVPVPVEIERKYLIKMPNVEELHRRYDCTTVDIIQTYLVEKEKGVERRVRQRGVNGNYTFYYTEKQKVNETTRTEHERKISESEYLELLMEADTSLHQIKKQRTCFISNGTYFEMDIYPFWNDKAILEVEVTKETDLNTIDIPKELEIIKDVTKDERYKNNSLAKTLDISNID